MFNFIKKSVIENRLQDELLYEYVMDELESDIKYKGLWAKAYSDSEGDSNKIEPLYMRYRVQAIKDIFTSLQIAYDKLPKEQIAEYLKNKVITKENNKLTWIDKETGLVWEVKNRKKIEKKFNFDESIRYAQKLNKESYAGFCDWRVPTKEELHTIVTEKKHNGKYTKEALSKNSSSVYWSSTTVASVTSSAWGVDFSFGNDYLYVKTGTNFVRCVRSVDN